MVLQAQCLRRTADAAKAGHVRHLCKVASRTFQLIHVALIAVRHRQLALPPLS